MSDGDDHTNRRNVLKAVGVGAASGAGLASAASAVSPDAVEGPAVDGEVVAERESTEPDRVVADLSAVAQSCSDCTTEYKCDSPACADYDQSLYERECCQCGGGDICGEWQLTSRCCF
ncbi:twin-arginine translocation signal domain-containing protein [Halobaculum sp. MBLA0147]|uniref:twin-arginine translocation signal domain-containing protein n=1 Tax=Halobaculum sp. MBLA0147 TaxID=3079934 RepID=UPI0035254C3C